MTEDIKTGLSRRTLAKGAAWTVPAAAVVAVAPSVAASPGVPTITSNDRACKLPGASCEGSTGVKKGYTISVRVCSNTPATITFTSALISMNGGPALAWTAVLNDQPDGDGCYNAQVSIDGRDSSQNVSLDGTITYTWKTSDGDTGTGSFEVHAPSTPPCDDCKPPASAAQPALTSQPAKVEEAKVEEAKVEEAKVEETKVEETKVEEAKVEEAKVEETKVEASPEPTATETPEPQESPAAEASN